MNPLRTLMWSPEEYTGLDAGIRFAVKVLHARGIETCQSCEGGPGHSYDRPTIDMRSGAERLDGFAALAELVAYGLPVQDVALLWSLSRNGLPDECLWRITFRESMYERADEMPMFVWEYRASEVATKHGVRPVRKK